MPRRDRVWWCGAIALLVVVAGCVPAPSTSAGDGHTSMPVVTPSAVDPTADTPRVRAVSLERIARRMTVRVRSRGCARVGTASGVAIGRRLLVTNRHVVAGADSIELNYWDGTSANARLESVAVADDLALVQVSLRLPSVARLADDDAPEGARMVIVGYPNGSEQAVVRGDLIEYAPLERHPDASPVMRLSAPIAPGNSGGPVVDASGTVVGVVFGIETATGHGLAVPSSAIRQLVEHRDQGGPVPACP